MTSGGLFAEPDFRRFWSAQVVSDFGSGVSTLALPLTAVLWLNASAMEMGVLRALATTPVLLFALLAGVWVDRLPRRPILVIGNAGRGLLLLAVPAAAAAGTLRIELLWGVAFAVGVLTVVFDIAVTSYVPSLVGRAQLVRANSTLQASSSAARVVGPGAAGLLVQLVGAPFAVVVDALSFFAGALWLGQLRAPEESGQLERRGVGAEIVEGVVAVWRDPILRAMVLATSIGSLGGAIQGAIFVLYATRDVGTPPETLGLVLACGSAAALAGAALAGPVSARLGAGGAMVAGQATIALGSLLVLGATPGLPAAIVLAAAQALMGGGLAVWSVTQLALRQAMTPPHLLGRVNATRRLVVFGVQPFGGLLGGALGEWVGLYAALAVAAVVLVLCALAMALSPLRTATEPSPGGRGWPKAG